MIGSSRHAVWMTLVFCIACEPSATQSGATVPNGASATQRAPDAPSAKPKEKAESPAKAWDKTIFVRDKRVDCEGEGPRLCMQVREAQSEEWTLFYGKIEGFSYEEGYAYELRVKVDGAKAPPADAPSQRLRLVEVVSKEKPPNPTRSPEQKAQLLAEATLAKSDLKLPRGGTVAGPCWKTLRHAAIESELDAEVLETLAQRASLPPIDLDGDGTADDVLFLGAAGMISTYAFYVRRGECGYHVGTLSFNGVPEPTPRFSKGLRELEATSGCPECCEETHHLKITFDGDRYAITGDRVTKKRCDHKP